MKLGKCLENIAVKLIAVAIVILMYLAFLFYKIIIPSIVIAYITKISLSYSIIIYMSFIGISVILKKLFMGLLIKKESLTPLEEILD